MAKLCSVNVLLILSKTVDFREDPSLMERGGPAAGVAHWNSLIKSENVHNSS